MTERIKGSDGDFQHNLRIEAAEIRLRSAFEKAFYIIRQARDEAARIGIPPEQIDEFYKNASGEGE
jgi:hypothetical protein